MKTKKSQFLQDALVVAAVVLILIILLFPFVWMVSSSLKPKTEIFSKNLEIIPRNATLANYKKLFFTTDFPFFFLNSFIVVSVSVLLTVVISALAAYSFSRYKFPGKDNLLVVILFSQFFPWIILVTPLYLVFQKLNLINNYGGLIILYIAITIPFCIFMLIGYFKSVTKDLDDAGRIDGCSEIGVLFRIVLPVSWPGLVAITAYAFIIGWNEFLFALTFMTKTKMKTVPVGLATLFGEFGIEWDIIMSAASMATVPAVIVFLFLQKYLVKGLTAGAIKG